MPLSPASRNTFLFFKPQAANFFKSATILKPANSFFTKNFGLEERFRGQGDRRLRAYVGEGGYLNSFGSERRYYKDEMSIEEAFI